MTVHTINDDDFIRFLSPHVRSLINISRYLAGHSEPRTIITRPLLMKFLAQATKAEELLDMYGASRNRNWSEFRRLVATIKRFSDISYELIHIRKSLPHYHLLEKAEEFGRATDDIIRFTGRVLTNAAKALAEYSDALGFRIPPRQFKDEDYYENLIIGCLAKNFENLKDADVAKEVALLATKFLGLAANFDLRNIIGAQSPKDYESYMYSPISEENFLFLEQSFHRLQSLYDTRVSRTNTENEDKDLIVLRGHISVVMHILRVASGLTHFYERHLGTQRSLVAPTGDSLVTSITLLLYINSFSVHYLKHFVLSARLLCQEMLKRYAQKTEIELPVPVFRGFHVRPTVLVSSIVKHYGSKVKVEYDGLEYDPETPLSMFSLNEFVNQKKRDHISNIINDLEGVNKVYKDGELENKCRDMLYQLYSENKIVIYSQPLQLSKMLSDDLTLRQNLTEEIKRQMQMGCLDVVKEYKVKFKGDQRVLDDIKLLAECGYGEDPMGHNIPLPERLRYLRR
jgi:hypothetical protein